MVDTRDLKSLDPWVMRVQVPLRVIVVDGRLPILTRVSFPFVSRKALSELSFVPQEKHPRVKTSNLLIPNYHSFAAPSNTRSIRKNSSISKPKFFFGGVSGDYR